MIDPKEQAQSAIWKPGRYRDSAEFREGNFQVYVLAYDEWLAGPNPENLEFSASLTERTEDGVEKTFFFDRSSYNRMRWLKSSHGDDTSDLLSVPTDAMKEFLADHQGLFTGLDLIDGFHGTTHTIHFLNHQTRIYALDTIARREREANGAALATPVTIPDFSSKLRATVLKGNNVTHPNWRSFFNTLIASIEAEKFVYRTFLQDASEGAQKGANVIAKYFTVDEFREKLETIIEDFSKTREGKDQKEFLEIKETAFVDDLVSKMFDIPQASLLQR